MKTKLCLLFVMAILATSHLAYGQAPTSSTPQTTTLQPAHVFIVLVPVSGPPVQYQYIGNRYITPHYPTYPYQSYRPYGYGYGGYGYGSGYRALHQTSRYFRHPNGRVYLVPRNRW